jgi:type II secretory ATPase GspE/PulE/Tfp pilus assembly ATPase PilB-like protein
LRGALAARAGLVLVCGPPGSGGSTLVAAIGACADLAGSRIIVFEPAPAAPWPGAARLHLPAGEAQALWEEVVTAQGADVVVLDDVLEGPAIDAVLSPAASQKLLIVRTDWCDSLALLERLARLPGRGATLAGRLVAIIQQRRVGQGTHLFEVLLPDEGVLQAIRSRTRLDEAARAAGWRTLAERARERVALGTLTELEAARSLT